LESQTNVSWPATAGHPGGFCTLYPIQYRHRPARSVRATNFADRKMGRPDKPGDDDVN
jgi:hypothetical protein